MLSHQLLLLRTTMEQRCASSVLRLSLQEVEPAEGKVSCSPADSTPGHQDEHDPAKHPTAAKHTETKCPAQKGNMYLHACMNCGCLGALHNAPRQTSDLSTTPEGIDTTITIHQQPRNQ